MKEPRLVESLRKFHGLPPYDKGINPCLHDPYLGASIQREWRPAQVAAAMAHLGLAPWGAIDHQPPPAPAQAEPDKPVTRVEYNRLMDRIQLIEDQLGMTEVSERVALKRQLKDFYVSQGFSGKQANNLAHADVRRGTTFEEAVAKHGQIQSRKPSN